MEENNMHMSAITIKKDKLIAKIKENRTEHEKIYKEAVAGYKIILEHELKEKLKKLEDGEFIDPYIRVSQPTNHLKEYDCAVSMLEYDIHETVVLSKSEFDCYILDDWSWKNSYISGSNANITGSLQYK